MNMVQISEPFRRHRWLGYGTAIVVALLSLAFRLLLGRALAGFPFLFPVAATILIAFLCGRGPAALTAVLSGLLAKYYFTPPPGTMVPSISAGFKAMLFYFVLCATLILLVHSLRAAFLERQQAEANLKRLNATLEERVIERTAALEAEMVERTAAQAELRQLQKMESIGQLTGGIAHDFNTMLAILMGSLDLARRRLGRGEIDRVIDALTDADEGARRAALLTRHLLAFARRQPLAPQPLDANRLVSGMSELLARTIGEHLRVETVLADGLWSAFADPGQLESALINLAVNARDAMPDGGRLIIETANVDLDAAFAQTEGDDVAPGPYVMIAVSDTGTGMAPDLVERVFEPFFTTKELGRGTGLGLSQVFGYVKQSGGHIRIYSAPGAGTTVRLYLPRHHGAAIPGEEAPSSARTPMPRGSADQIVLVVEDEPRVRRMSVEALRELGYTVLEADGGPQAVARYGAHDGISLLFTDVMMPDMNGREVADRFRLVRPDLPVLFTTGYARTAVVHHGVVEDGVAILPKPFTIEQLARKVDEALAAPIAS